jgi:hypothetical protein
LHFLPSFLALSALFSCTFYLLFLHFLPFFFVLSAGVIFASE